MEKMLTHGEQKIREYVARIQNGEPRAVVLAGLSPTFISGVDQQLGATKNQAEPTGDILESEETGNAENPPIVYSETVVDDAYMEANLVQVGTEFGLRMQGGQANWNGEVEIKKYVVSDNLSPQYRKIAAEKIELYDTRLEKTYQHEAKHIRNRENGLAPHVAAESLREFLAFRVLDEMSAFATSELYKQEMDAETVMQALYIAEQRVASEYYSDPFTSDANWYMRLHGSEPEAHTRPIDTERYHKILRQYFNINGKDIFAILQKENRLPEFTNLINGLIGKLDQILHTVKSE